MNRTVHKAAVAAASLILLGSLVACSSEPSTVEPSGEAGPLKIGVPLALTGSIATVGSWARAGVETAAQEINDAGGINGREVELVILDTEGNPTKAVSTVTRLINQDAVDFIVGPMTSDETLAILPMTNDANMASINGSGSAITPENAPLSFAMLLNASDQAAKMVDLAVEEFGAERVATINYSATQGQTAAKSFIESLDALGLEPVASAEYANPVTDMTPQLLSAQQGDPDMLLLFSQSGSDTGQFVLAQRALNMTDIPAIGSYASTFVAQTKGVAGEDAFEGLDSVTWSAFGACSADDVRPQATGFIDLLQSTLSADVLATMSYDYAAVWHDAVILLAAAYEETGSTDGAGIAKWLETEGPAAAEANPLIVHAGWAMSETNHFLFDADSLALVNAGTEVAPKIFQRIDC